MKKGKKILTESHLFIELCTCITSVIGNIDACGTDTWRPSSIEHYVQDILSRREAASNKQAGTFPAVYLSCISHPEALSVKLNELNVNVVKRFLVTKVSTLLFNTFFNHAAAYTELQ